MTEEQLPACMASSMIVVEAPRPRGTTSGRAAVQAVRSSLRVLSDGSGLTSTRSWLARAALWELEASSTSEMFVVRLPEEDETAGRRRAGDPHSQRRSMFDDSTLPLAGLRFAVQDRCAHVTPAGNPSYHSRYDTRLGRWGWGMRVRFGARVQRTERPEVSVD